MLIVSHQGPGFQMDNVGVVILAGGQGRRMGGGKPERPFRGRRLIDPVLDLVSAWDVPAVICVRDPGQVSGDGFEQIVDWPDLEGPLAGLLSGFDWAQRARLGHFLTLPCDAPMLPADLLSRLLRACLDAGRPAVATSHGRCHPTCAVWPADATSRVTEYAQTGRRSLAGALDVCEAIEVEWREPGSDPFINLNTPEDLIRYQP